MPTMDERCVCMDRTIFFFIGFLSSSQANLPIANSSILKVCSRVLKFGVHPTYILGNTKFQLSSILVTFQNKNISLLPTTYMYIIIISAISFTGKKFPKKIRFWPKQTDFFHAKKKGFKFCQILKKEKSQNVPDFYDKFQ